MHSPLFIIDVFINFAKSRAWSGTIRGLITIDSLKPSSNLPAVLENVDRSHLSSEIKGAPRERLDRRIGLY